jgi:hypothetical protein
MQDVGKTGPLMPATRLRQGFDGLAGGPPKLPQRRQAGIRFLAKGLDSRFRRDERKFAPLAGGYNPLMSPASISRRLKRRASAPPEQR